MPDPSIPPGHGPGPDTILIQPVRQIVTCWTGPGFLDWGSDRGGCRPSVVWAGEALDIESGDWFTYGETRESFPVWRLDLCQREVFGHVLRWLIEQRGFATDERDRTVEMLLRWADGKTTIADALALQGTYEATVAYARPMAS